MRLISWTLRSGSEQLVLVTFEMLKSLVHVTVGLSPDPKVDELLVHPEDEHLYAKI
jgi:hypothetical protein